MVGTHRGLSPTVKKAHEYYHSGIKNQLTEEDHGRYVVINAHTGEWMVGDSVEVVFEMRDRTSRALIRWSSNIRMFRR